MVDKSKEQSLEAFASKRRCADCHLINTLPCAPWMQAVDGCIKQCKQECSRMMLKMNVPKKLQNHSIELQVIVMLHTVLDIYGLDRAGT